MSTKKATQVQSRQNRGRGYPNPEAEHPISARLESVRTHFGFKSKRAFWQNLCDGWGDAVSYEAARNYHYDREPPPSYLARVLGVFPDVRSEWLLMGKPPMLHSEPGVSEEVYGFIERAKGDQRWKRSVRLKFEVLSGLGFPDPDLSPTPLEEEPAKNLVAYFRSVDRGHVPRWVPVVADATGRLDVDAVQVGKALWGALEALGVDPTKMDRDALADYIVGMVPVLLALAPEIQRQRETTHEETTDE